MYEEIIDWVALSELIGVIPAALLKMAFIWLPLIVLFGLYLIYSLERGKKCETELQKYLQTSKIHVGTRYDDSEYRTRNIL